MIIFQRQVPPPNGQFIAQDSEESAHHEVTEKELKDMHADVACKLQSITNHTWRIND